MQPVLNNDGSSACLR